MSEPGSDERDPFDFALEELTSMFEGATSSGRTKGQGWTKDEICIYATCLNQGDGELVITALVRSVASHRGSMTLDAVLSERRKQTWLDIAAKHADLSFKALRDAARRLRQAERRRTGFSVAMFDVPDDAVDAVTKAFSSPEAALALPNLHISVEDQLTSYSVALVTRSEPDALGLRWLRRTLEDLEPVTEGFFLDEFCVLTPGGHMQVLAPRSWT